MPMYILKTDQPSNHIQKFLQIQDGSLLSLTLHSKTLKNYT